jgi:hypothetical protein
MRATTPRGDDPDLRSAYASLTAPADVPAPILPSIRARINERRQHRRRRVTATICAAALVVGGGLSSIAYTTATQVPVTTSAGRSGALPAGTAASCAFPYSAAEVRRRTDWAADATVTQIRRSILSREARVTLSVSHWYQGGTGDEITLSLTDPLAARTTEDPHPMYGIGTRLLLAGSRQDTQLFAWSCGFTRYYTPDTAAAWSKAFDA